MINLERSKEVHIKRANGEWWINEKAIVADNGKTYIVYITDMGEIHIKEMDAKCSKVASRDFRLCKLNCNYADQHNAPALCVLESGKIIVAYTGHRAAHCMWYRVTERPYDISSFGPVQKLYYDDVVSYTQIFENTERNELWLFTRVGKTSWAFRTSKDEGKTWSEPKTFLYSDQGGLFYFNARKQHVLTPTGTGEQWFFALYGHPRVSKDHTIRSGIFNSDGQLLKTDGTPTDWNLFDKKYEPIVLDTLDTVYASPEGTTVRLLDVSPTVPLRVAFAPFVLDKEDAPDPTNVNYYSATFRDGAWQVSEPICNVGEFVASNIMDGSQTALLGVAYYYGVGDAGRSLSHKNAVGHTAKTTTDRIYIARRDGDYAVLESYLSQDSGRTYSLEQVIRRIPKGTDNMKIWLPIVPIHAQDNMPVYWHEGTFTAHTGGWHCDEVMLVEYDD